MKNVILLSLILLITNNNALAGNNLPAESTSEIQRLYKDALATTSEIKKTIDRINHINFCMINNKEILFVPSAEIQINTNMENLDVLYETLQEIYLKIHTLQKVTKLLDNIDLQSRL